jgi:hypothetical protein
MSNGAPFSGVCFFPSCSSANQSSILDESPLFSVSPPHFNSHEPKQHYLPDYRVNFHTILHEQHFFLVIVFVRERKILTMDSLNQQDKADMIPTNAVKRLYQLEMDHLFTANNSKCTSFSHITSVMERREWQIFTKESTVQDADQTIFLILMNVCLFLTL